MNSKNNNIGFTLVELIVAVAISGVIMTGIYSAFKTQQDSYLVQEQVAEVQQNIRASIDYMMRDLRMAGFDPTQSGNFSITDVRSRDLDNVLDVGGNPAITFTVDLNEDGTLDLNETISYSLYEYPVSTPADSDGISDLSLTQGGGGRQLLGESIIAMGLAYSYVGAGGDVVTDAGGNVIWAIDSDNDNDLDRDLDTNNDGVIDIADNPLGTALATDIDIENIVAIKIWLLAQTKARNQYFTENRTFVVANQRITPNDNNRHRLMETTVQCRNMGL
ncbi:prepilin-type N-terminal cleavage/methylation domain-containing protein [uncultured Desulfuromusa sp.]|uniref:prepilin-type N-terminal cleavage/methylation domain-containing protein n=1 Tax=uncultured Desulfuromusa sp. TaxID=219183 RepID=UPI002AA67A25|nr:prepilin-type N-terminal cleavage/methylation domain-containing protein [uncultured Desulfuromusa sp.]